jgi:hypothetical protein
MASKVKLRQVYAYDSRFDSSVVFREGGSTSNRISPMAARASLPVSWEEWTAHEISLASIKGGTPERDSLRFKLATMTDLAIQLESRVTSRKICS